jgi:hypothetical protein
MRDVSMIQSEGKLWKIAWRVPCQRQRQHIATGYNFEDLIGIGKINVLSC